MKFIRNVFLIFFVLLQISLFSVYAESNVVDSKDDKVQFVLPKNVYVGDTAEIRYVFHTDVNLLSDEINVASSYLELITDFRLFKKMSEKCLVKKASITRAGTEYTLTLEIVVWSAEKIDFPPFDLGNLIHYSKENVASPVFWVDLDPIIVNSIAKKNGVTSFLPPKSPILLPGTTLIIFAVSILSLIVLFILIFSLTHIPVISDFIERLLISIQMKKNARVAVRKLKKLIKKSLSDADFAFELQCILREFLSSHFKEDFSSATTSDFARAFNRIFLEDVPLEFDRFVDIFSRTDYIRFARGQVDSNFQKTAEIDEMKNLVDEIIFTISALGREVSLSRDSASRDSAFNSAGGNL